MVRVSTLLAVLAFGLASCGTPPAKSPPPKKFEVGGEWPISANRLVESHLFSINDPVVEWQFTMDRFLVQAGKEPLPKDLADALIGPGANVMRAEGKWAHDEAKSELILTEIHAFDNKGVEKLVVPIVPAGMVRANLGNRQYNVIPKSRLHQEDQAK